MPGKMPAGRSREDVIHQYEVEKDLAAKLLAAPREQRRILYAQVYDEMYRKCPDHPQLVIKNAPALCAARVAMQISFLRHYLSPEQTFMEIGPGDCGLAVEVARRVKRCIAIDVSDEITRQSRFPENLQLLLSDGSSIPVPDGTVDLAYSNQLMEHLHPEDALVHLENVHGALRPGGRYVCRTPNRLSGPHDISGPFDDIATGFHLREYANKDLARLLRRAGFSSITGFIMVRGRHLSRPLISAVLAESVLDLIPASLRRTIAAANYPQIFLAVNIVATK